MKLKFKDIKSNPYRDLKGNPLLKEKIAELVSSINTTGFWDNVVVRKAKNGDYQLAYGHHRVQAAIEAGLVEADFIVKDLSDALMIQIMDNENREVYASSPASLIEAVKAVVSALAEGRIGPLPIDWQKTNTQHIRYAPSYVPTKELLVEKEQQAYTVVSLARFLGRTYKGDENGRERASHHMEAALNFLQLKEVGVINSSILVKDKKPISASKLFEITSEIKVRHVAEVERRNKTAAEVAELRQQQLDAQKKLKADEDAAEASHKALVQKLADAKRAENERTADALLKKLREDQEKSRNTEVRNKLAMQALDEKIAQKKLWEAEQRVQDTYMPIRRDVEAMIRKLENIVTEHNPFREDVKSLSKRKGIRSEDLLRLRKATVAVADWYGGWVASQFAPELKAAQKVAVDKRKAAQIRTKGSGA